MLTTGLTLLASALLLYAALHDLGVRTVPDWLWIGLLVLGCGARLADHSFLIGAAVAACTFVVLFVVWLLGAMGGGDVKLWAATVLLIPPLLQLELAFFMHVVIFGGVLAVVYLCLWPMVRKPAASRAGGLLRRMARAEVWRMSRRGPLPYACAIAGGALVTLLPLTLQR
jgi:prepilin peptidase CpaA